MAKILETGTPEALQRAVRQAAQLLRAGDVVAVPTETVYGLAADATNPEAVRKLFAVKERPSYNPIIVHVASLKMAQACVARWPELAGRLAQAFWPGPLTLVLPRSGLIPDVVTAGGSTVGVRWPAHPVMQAIIEACGFPIAAPSANAFTRLSPTSADHVRKGLGRRIQLIVDGGSARVGIESTVLDISVSPAHLLRPGIIHEESLLAVTGRLETGEVGTGTVLKSPGRLPKHYAPRARLLITTWADEPELRRRITAAGFAPAATHVLTYDRLPASTGFGRVVMMPRDPQPYARALYGELHRCDEGGAALIVVAELPAKVEWRAITDRLKRAAAR